MDFVFDRNKTAIYYKGVAYSFKDIIEMSKFYSSKIDIKRNDIVGVFIENRPEFIESVFAIWNKKGTSVNIDSGYDADQLAYVLKDCSPKYLFTTEKNFEIAIEAKKIASSNTEILKVEDLIKPADFKVEKCTIEAPEKDDIAVMLYTSGTTGNPKGVMLTIDNLMSNIDAVNEINLVNENDSVLAMLPFHHILPFNLTLLMPLYFGCKNVILEELSSEAIKKNLAEHKISVMIGVPRIWEMFHKGIMAKINTGKVTRGLFNLCEKMNNKTLSKKIFKKVHEAFGGNIRILVSGGAKLEPQISKDFSTLGFNMLEGYGLTETSPIIAFNRPNDNVPGTVGTTIPGVQIKIAEDGEIIVKGRNVMKGYYNKPEATEEAIDKDGWFHTGDLGALEGNHLTIIGRKKEMIVLSNGKKINPSDVEAEIMKGTDLIEEIAITDYDNHLVAIIYPSFERMAEKNITNIKEALKWEIIDKYNVTAPKYRKILDIRIVKEELPKTKLGKLRRFMLKDLIKDDVESNGNEEIKKTQATAKVTPVSTSKELETKEFKSIAKYIKKLHDVEVYPEAYIEIDLGMDSLDIVELISFIESNFGVEIHEMDFAKIKTVEQLCEFIRQHGGNYNDKDIDWQEIFNEPVDFKIPHSATSGKILKTITAPIFKFYTKLKKEGMENIPKDPAIYIGNHQSFLDGFALNQVFSKEKMDNTYYLAVSDHFESSLRKYLADHGNILLLDINKNLKETLQICAKVLKDGKNLVIYPEGARTRDGEVQEFKKAFAILSKELNIPVVPVGIKGAYELMPYGSNFPKYGELEIKIFPKIEPKDLTVEEIVEKSRSILEKWIQN